MTDIVKTSSIDAVSPDRIEIMPVLQHVGTFAPVPRPANRVEPGWVNMLVYAIRGAAAACPDLVPSAILRRAKIVWIWLSDFETLRTWRLVAEELNLGPTSKQHPLGMGVAVWPYIHAKWEFKQRVDVILEHYRRIELVAPRLALAVDGSLVLATLDDIRPGLKLVIDRAPWFVREGELVLNIFLHDQRLFSVAFALGLDGIDNVIRIGGIQGVRDQNIVDLYRDLTKELHGIRPRDFILAALKILCTTLGIGRILAIADINRQHRNSYFSDEKLEKLGGNYDEIWSEHDGILNDSGFFELSSKLTFRSTEEIPARKRGLYRRRYDFLKQLENSVNDNLADIVKHID